MQHLFPIHLPNKNQQTAQTFELLEKYNFGKAGQRLFAQVGRPVAGWLSGWASRPKKSN